MHRMTRPIVVLFVLATSSCASLPRGQYRNGAFLHQDPPYSFQVPSGWRPATAIEHASVGHARRQFESLTGEAKRQALEAAAKAWKEFDAVLISTRGASILVSHGPNQPGVSIPRGRSLTLEEQRAMKEVLGQRLAGRFGAGGAVKTVDVVAYGPNTALRVVWLSPTNITMTMVWFFEASSIIHFFHVGIPESDSEGFDDFEELARSVRFQPASPGPSPVGDPAQRLDFPGVSILPPRGGNWFITPPVPSGPGATHTVVAFGKKLREGPPATPEEAHTIRATVVVSDLREARFEDSTAFLGFLERESGERMVGRMVNKRHRLLASELSLDSSPGSTCVKYEQTFEDTGVPRFPGSIFILATRGFRCLHPHWPKYMVDVGYSQRYLRGQRPLSIEAELEPFLKSVVFAAARPMGERLRTENVME